MCEELVYFLHVRSSFTRLKRRKRREESLTGRAWAEPPGEDPGRPAGGPGEGAHPGVVPLPGDGGLVAEVTLELQSSLTALHVQPLRVPITREKQRSQHSFPHSHTLSPSLTHTHIQRYDDNSKEWEFSHLPLDIIQQRGVVGRRRPAQDVFIVHRDKPHVSGWSHGQI